MLHVCKLGLVATTGQSCTCQGREWTVHLMAQGQRVASDAATDTQHRCDRMCGPDTTTAARPQIHSTCNCDGACATVCAICSTIEWCFGVVDCIYAVGLVIRENSHCSCPSPIDHRIPGSTSDAISVYSLTLLLKMFTVSRPARAGACAARPIQSTPCTCRGTRPICRAESEKNRTSFDVALCCP